MKELTRPPLEMFPPNKSSTESDTPVESRRNTELTFTFSLKTSHGYGILGIPAFTEFYLIRFRINNHQCNQNFDESAFPFKSTFAYKNEISSQTRRNSPSTKVLAHPPLFLTLLTSLYSVETKLYQQKCHQQAKDK